MAAYDAFNGGRGLFVDLDRWNYILNETTVLI